MAERVNQRIAITKKMLKSSLTELLKTKSIYKISIRELCEKAEINRSTFYKYYGSQFDLLTEMEGDVLSLIMEALPSDTNSDGHALIEMCRYLEDNIDLGRLLINNNIDPQFPEKVFALPQVQQVMNRILGDAFSGSEYEYISNFLTYGAYQMIRIWINKENRESPEEMAQLLLHRIIKMI